MLLNTS